MNEDNMLSGRRLLAALLAIALAALGVVAAPAMAQEEATGVQFQLTDEDVRIVDTVFDEQNNTLIVIEDIVLNAGEDEAVGLFEENPVPEEGLFADEAEEDEFVEAFGELGFEDGAAVGVFEQESELFTEDEQLFTEDEEAEVVDPTSVRAVLIEQGVNETLGESAMRVALVFQGVTAEDLGVAGAQEQPEAAQEPTGDENVTGENVTAEETIEVGEEPVEEEGETDVVETTE